MHNTIVQRSAIVPYSPKQMFSLVNDVSSYPRFLPWCRSAKVLSFNGEKMCAEIEFAKGGVRKSFSTCNLLSPDNRIEIQLREGPFRNLNGIWTFSDIQGQGTKVNLELSFAFANRLIEMAIGPVFNYIANNMVDAFCKRASQLYGSQRESYNR